MDFSKHCDFFIDVSLLLLKSSRKLIQVTFVLLSTWDWINGSKKNEFRNNDYLDGYDNNTHISDMLFVNQHTADAMLIVANGL